MTAMIMPVIEDNVSFKTFLTTLLAGVISGIVYTLVIPSVRTRLTAAIAMTIASAPGLLLAFYGWGYEFYLDAALLLAVAAGLGFSVLWWEPLKAPGDPHSDSGRSPPET